MCAAAAAAAAAAEVLPVAVVVGAEGLPAAAGHPPPHPTAEVTACGSVCCLAA